jgi:hypothetical protein
MKYAWKKYPQSAQFEGSNWGNYKIVRDVGNERAARNHIEDLLSQGVDIGSYFHCKSSFSLTNGTSFNTGDLAYFPRQNFYVWLGNATQADTYIIDVSPRNAVWCGPAPTENLQPYKDSYYTQFLVCFFYLENGRILYKDGQDPSMCQALWDQLASMQLGEQCKTTIMAVGGWGSRTWEFAKNDPQGTASKINSVMQLARFNGVDFNFEGYYRNDPDQLRTMAQMMVELRHLAPDALLSITPMFDNVVPQLEAIDDEASRRDMGGWRDILNVVNVQCYFYNNDNPVPFNAVDVYHSTKDRSDIDPSMLTAGFPLGFRAEWNIWEACWGMSQSRQLFNEFPLGQNRSRYGGSFVWEYGLAHIPANLNWDKMMEAVFYRHTIPPGDAGSLNQDPGPPPALAIQPDV